MPDTNPVHLYWTDPDTGISEELVFDQVDGENHEDTSELTRHPVEIGAATSDHIVKNPALLTLEGTVSRVLNPRIDKDVKLTAVPISVKTGSAPQMKSVPLDIPTPPIQPSPSGLLQAGIGALKSLIAGQPRGTFQDRVRYSVQQMSAQMWVQDSKRDRVRDFYDKLSTAYDKGALFTISTDLREYFDMVLTRLPVRLDNDTGNAAAFSIDFERIKVADSQTVQSPEPAEKRGAAGKSAGSKNSKDDPNGEAKDGAMSSTLNDMTGG